MKGTALRLFVLFGLFLFFSGLSWVQGYYLDVTIPGGLFHPLVVLSLALFALCLFVETLARIWVASPEEKTLVLSGIGLMLLLSWTNVIPHGLDGARLKAQFLSRQDYHDLASIMDEYLANDGSTSRLEHSPEFRAGLQRAGLWGLWERLLGLSSFPLAVFVKPNGYALEWGSGLTGGYIALYFETEAAANDYLRENKNSIQVNPNVVLFRQTD